MKDRQLSDNRFWKRLEWWELSHIVDMATFVIVLCYTLVSYKQLEAIRTTNTLTKQALDSSGADLSKTLMKMQGQIDATDDLARHAGQEAMSVQHLAYETKSEAQSMATLATASSAQAATNRALAEAASRSAKIAADSLKSSLDAARPWIGLDDYTVDPLVPGSTIRFNLQLKNTGARPATVMIAAASAKEPPSDHNVLQPLHFYTATTNPEILLLPGGTTRITPGGVGLPKAPKTAAERTQPLYLFVTVAYSDVVTKEWHTTQLCLTQDDGPLSTGDSRLEKQGFLQCGYYQNAN